MQATIAAIWDSANLKQFICNPEQIIEPSLLQQIDQSTKMSLRLP